MKHRILILGLATLILASPFLYAQDGNDDRQLYIVHQDDVMPSMVAKYEEAAKGVISTMSDNGVAQPAFLCAQQGSFRYLYVLSVDNMAALDQNLFGPLAEKLGEEGMKEMWGKYDGTIETHKNVMATLRQDLSYTTAGSDMMNKEQPFRHWSYYYVMADKDDEAIEISKEWKALYESKGVEHGYRIYTGGIGMEVPVIVVVQSAKSAEEFYARQAKTNELLGDEAVALWQKTMAITRKHENVDGRIRFDMSNLPSEEGGTN